MRANQVLRFRCTAGLGWAAGLLAVVVLELVSSTRKARLLINNLGEISGGSPRRAFC